MSLLRFTRPGKPIEPSDFVDLGPDTGRTTHTRGMVKGGAIVEVSKVNVDYYAKRRRIQQIVTRENRRIPEPVPGRCNALMETHDRCGRRPLHRLGHRSYTALEREREHKRSERAA
jgi:hypothetical protein